jgi:hypothetical protein
VRRFVTMIMIMEGEIGQAYAWMISNPCERFSVRVRVMWEQLAQLSISKPVNEAQWRLCDLSIRERSWQSERISRSLTLRTSKTALLCGKAVIQNHLLPTVACYIYGDH